MSVENETDNNNDKLQSLIKCLSCLPCFPKYEPKPDTPNIDRLRELLNKFKGEYPESTDINVIERSKADELANWTKTVLKYLPGIENAPEDSVETRQIVTHFTTIKKFYNSAENAGFDSPELDIFFNSLQIYETVMPLAFIVFHDHPETINKITESIKSAIGKTEGHSDHGCCTITLCGAALLSRFNSILKIVDDAIGEFNVEKVVEFVLEIIEVFCKYFDIELEDLEKLKALWESIEKVIDKVKEVFGDIIPGLERGTKWGPLRISEKIKSKLDELDDTGSKIIGRTMDSFENFFKAVEKIDDKYQGKKAQMKSRSLGADEEIEIGEMKETDFPIKDVSGQTLASRISQKTDITFDEITKVAKIFQYIDAIFSYDILLLKNEEAILSPILDRVDECARILNKFFDLHPLYQIALGKNYLSKLEVVLKEVLELLKDPKLKFNNPEEFLKEFKSEYPHLICILYKVVLGNDLIDKFKDIDFGDGFENAKDKFQDIDIGDGFENAKDKFKDKFSWL